MIELITELRRKESGLYDVTIKTNDGRVLLDVRGVNQRQARRMIDKTEQVVNDEKEI